VKAGEQRTEVLRTDGEHRRQADRRVHRVAPPDPVPELEHVHGVDAELGDFRGIGRDGYEVVGDRLALAAKTPQRPRASGLSVGHRFECRESLRRNDEQRFGRIEIADGFDEIGAVDVGDEPKRHGALAVRLQRFIGHHGPEVGAADADVDDVADALTGVSLPDAAANAVRKVARAIEHRVDLRHDVLPIHSHGGALGRTQRGVQDSSILGDIDALAAEHGIDALAQARLLREPQQQ
jgi:hypothetical protein